jgi:3-oxoadipate enol-lactonase
MDLIWLGRSRRAAAARWARSAEAGPSAPGLTLLCVPGTMCSPRIFVGLAEEGGLAGAGWFGDEGWFAGEGGLAGAAGLGLPVAAVPWLEWPGPHDMATLGAMVAEHAAALSPVVLVGHSTGGVIALSAALRARPGAVAGIVLCDTGANMHGHGDVDAIIERVRRDCGPALWEQVVRRSVHLEPGEAALADLLAYPARISPAAVEEALRSQRNTDLLPELHRLAGLPALVVHGIHDQVRPVSHAQELAAALGGAPLGGADLAGADPGGADLAGADLGGADLTLLGCGHSPPVEMPGLFNAVVGRWLRKLPQTDPWLATAEGRC